MRSAIAITALPGSVIETRRLPWRTNTWMPSSSSSARICFDTPGWEVCSASAASETFRPAAGDFRQVAELLQLHRNGFI